MKPTMPLLYTMSKVFKFSSSALGFCANLAGASALFAGAYAFFNPKEAAQKFVSFEELLMEARGDLDRIAVASEETAESTARTASNTDILAAAVPYWIRFESQGAYSSNYTIYSMHVENPSNFPIELTWKVYHDGNLMGGEDATVMPLEDYAMTWPWGRASNIMLCLSGTSPALGNIIYERRVYGDENTPPVRSLEPIEGCD